MNSMTSSAYRRVLLVAGALIAVDLDGATERLRRDFDDAWVDAIVPNAIDADITLDAASHVGSGLDSLANDILKAAEDVLRGRDVWVIRAALLINGVRGILLVPGGDETISTWADIRGSIPVLAPTLVSVDPHGKLSVYRAPARVAGRGELGMEPPSAVDGVSMVPVSIRLSGVLLLEQSEAAGAKHLGLEDSLVMLTDRLGLSWGSRAPLRSLSRLISNLCGVIQGSYLEPADIVGMVALLEDEESAAFDGVAQEKVVRSEQIERQVVDGSRVYRAGVVDVLETDTGGVILLLPTQAGRRIKVLRGDQAEIWTRAGGVSQKMLLGESSSSPKTLRAYQQLNDEGLLASEPSWGIADGVAWTDGAETTAVLDLKNPGATPLVFDRSARSVWLVLVNRSIVSQGELARSVAAEYGVSVDVVAEDVGELLEQLRRERLVAQL